MAVEPYNTIVPRLLLASENMACVVHSRHCFHSREQNGTNARFNMIMRADPQNSCVGEPLQMCIKVLWPQKYIYPYPTRYQHLFCAPSFLQTQHIQATQHGHSGACCSNAGRSIGLGRRRVYVVALLRIGIGAAYRHGRWDMSVFGRERDGTK